MNCLILFSNKLDNFNQNNYNEIVVGEDKKILSKIKKYSEVDIFFNFENLKLNKNNTSKYIKIIRKIGNYLIKKNKKFKIINEYNLEKTKNDFEAYLLISTIAMTIRNKRERTIYLYDEICKFLDYQFTSKNLCEFGDDNMCFAKRGAKTEMGCCHHYKHLVSGLFFEKNMKLCQYQQEKSCKADCITCKMFVCDEIIKKGIKFTNNNVLVIKYYFNIFQKIIIKISFFTKREKILKKLIFFS